MGRGLGVEYNFVSSKHAQHRQSPTQKPNKNICMISEFPKTTPSNNENLRWPIKLSADDFGDLEDLLSTTDDENDCKGSTKTLSDQGLAPLKDCSSKQEGQAPIPYQQEKSTRGLAEQSPPQRLSSKKCEEIHPPCPSNAPDLLSLRMLNLPMVLCSTCTGAPFSLSLKHVQNTAAAQRLGESDFKLARAMSSAIRAGTFVLEKAKARRVRPHQRMAALAPLKMAACGPLYRNPSASHCTQVKPTAKALRRGKEAGVCTAGILHQGRSPGNSSGPQQNRQHGNGVSGRPRAQRPRGHPGTSGDRRKAVHKGHSIWRRHSPGSLNSTGAPKLGDPEGFPGDHKGFHGDFQNAKGSHELHEGLGSARGHETPHEDLQNEQKLQALLEVVPRDAPAQRPLDIQRSGVELNKLPPGAKPVVGGGIQHGQPQVSNITMPASSPRIQPGQKLPNQAGASPRLDSSRDTRGPSPRNIEKSPIKDETARAFRTLQSARRMSRKTNRTMNKRAIKDWGAVFESQGHTSFDHDVDVTHLDGLHDFAEEAEIKTEGVEAYETKCRQVGVPVSAMVAQELCKREASLAGLHLGGAGARALGHALACNTVIETLHLSDNNLDGQAVVHIVRGLLAASGASPLKPAVETHGIQQTGGTAKEDDVTATVVDRSASLWSQHAQHSEKATKNNLPVDGQVGHLGLASNPIGSTGVHAVCLLLDPAHVPLQLIRRLELDDCRVPDVGGMALATVIARAEGACVLEHLSLSKNNMGDATALAFGEALKKNRSLRTLILSWNRITGDGAAHLAKGLAKNSTLTHLDLAWNGLGNAGCMLLAQTLQVNLGLQELNLSRTRMGTEAAIVLAHVLAADNSTLKRVQLSGNELGESGGWHLMAALTSSTYLQHVGLQGATFLPVSEGSTVVRRFNPMHPEGKHRMELSSPAERSIAAYVMRLDQMGKGAKVSSIILDGKKLPGRPRDWPRRLPTSGVLELEIVNGLREQLVEPIEEGQLVNLLHNLENKDMSENERLSMVVLFALSHHFTADDAASVLRMFGMGEERAFAAAFLFTRLLDYDNVQTLTRELSRRDLEIAQRQLGWLSTFRCDHPSGTYELNLAVPLHRYMVYRLIELSRSEGSALTWRNVTHGNLVLHSSAGPPDSWEGLVPQQGVLCLDYTTSLKPGDAEAMPDAEFQAVLKDRTAICLPSGENGMSSGPQDGSQHLSALRSISPYLKVSAAQVARVINFFRDSADRVEALVMLYPRMVDPENVWQPIYALQGVEQAAAMIRLGMPAAFRPARCTAHFLLDFSNQEHANVAMKLVDIALQSPRQQHFYNLRSSGRPLQVAENGSMWAVFTTSSFTPILEFDYAGPDAADVAGCNKKRGPSMSQGEKTEAMARQTSRAAGVRLKQMHSVLQPDLKAAGADLQHKIERALSCPTDKIVGASSTASPYGRPSPIPSPTAALQGGARAGIPPWKAAWRRLIQRLVTLEGTSCTPLKDLFAEAAGGSNKICWNDMMDLMAAKGFSKEEIGRAETELAKIIANPVRQNPVTPALEKIPAGQGRAGAQSDLPGKSPPRGSTWKQAPDPRVLGGEVQVEDTMRGSGRVPIPGVTSSGIAGDDPVITWTIFERIWMLE
eukprot:jgi/Botrbrau1/6616/Bobra.104_2s0004.1